MQDYNKKNNADASKKEEIAKKIEEATLKQEDAKDANGKKQDVSDEKKDAIANSDAKESTQAPVSKEEEYLDMSRRIHAEFDNYRKRAEKESESFRKYAAAEFVKKMLPVLDSFELAIKNSADSKNGAKNSTDAEKFRKGMELIYAQFYSVLKDLGVEKIECINKKFDPYKHEVLMVDTCSKCAEGTVVEEFQKGYMFKDHVLRYSKVKIAKKENSTNKCE
jgi:molecular chaperone GrpE